MGSVYAWLPTLVSSFLVGLVGFLLKRELDRLSKSVDHLAKEVGDLSRISAARSVEVANLKESFGGLRHELDRHKSKAHGGQS